MQMYVRSRWNRLFRGANWHTTLVHLFFGLDIAGCDLVPNDNILREDYFVPINHVTVPRPYGLNYNEHIIVAMDS
jgi:hypothetical protein